MSNISNNTEQNKLPWYRRHDQAIVSIGLVGFIFGIIGILISFFGIQPDFGIGIDCKNIQIKPGDVIPIKVTIRDNHEYIRPFNRVITLNAYEEPPNTLIKFAPFDSNIPTFDQLMIISTLPNAPKGVYPIKIWAECRADSPSDKCTEFTIKII